MEEHHLPPEEQRAKRAGRENGMKIFNKSKEYPLRKLRSEWAAEWKGRRRLIFFTKNKDQIAGCPVIFMDFQSHIFSFCPGYQLFTAKEIKLISGFIEF